MVTIVSSNGQKAGEFSFDGATNVTIPVAQLPQGVYFMQTTLDNNQMQILKVMVNH
jgi:hypothetical protein